MGLPARSTIRAMQRRLTRLLDGLNARLSGSPLTGLENERSLVEAMRGKAAIFAGYAGEIPKQLKPLTVLGKWRVLRHDGVKDLSRGDIVEFTSDNEFITYFKRPRRDEDEMYQSFEINARQISIPDGDLVVDYAVSGNKLRLTTADGFVKIILERAGDVQVGS